ncbi:MAG: hypothetical protein AB7P18_23435 [Candidatus Binatia bacterium]
MTRTLAMPSCPIPTTLPSEERSHFAQLIETHPQFVSKRSEVGVLDAVPPIQVVKEGHPFLVVDRNLVAL